MRLLIVGESFLLLYSAVQILNLFLDKYKKESFVYVSQAGPSSNQVIQQ